MKQLFKISIASLAIVFSTSVFAQAKTETFKVSGNCGSCKKHIEDAAKQVPGVTKAVWNKDSKKMTVAFTGTASVDAIEKKIASVGYDTPMYKGDDKAYKALDECCQYDRSEVGAAMKKGMKM